ncbi:hypothetical protein D9613_007473 [Agrocybe pediades]|uniref:Uncharacterized protein n=1 Tax=Agrocybe pediades TaxID=84607 RepID=A0A8H4QN24_9AGAR|nr:hypothetical protein D9613_007473 [Agrocybe pediades]
MANTYGRNRQSIADIEQVLNDIFLKHPDVHINAQGEPAVPGDGVFAILKSFEDLYNGTPLLSDEEAAMLQKLLEEHKDIEVTTPLLMQLVAEKTKAVTPPASPLRDSDSRSSEEDSGGDSHTRSRTSSNESMGEGQYARPMSRPPSCGPTTPSIKSPLDSERRQRSTPLNAPSSWSSKRPTRAGRRKSDAGNRSDSEGGPPTVWGRTTGHGPRARTPSNPASPTSSNRDLSFSPGSPEFSVPRSRPHSRAQSQPQSSFMHSSFDLGYSSPDDTVVTHSISRFAFDSFENQVSTLPMPRTGDESDDEELDEGLGLVHDRTSSIVSMEINERLEALQRTNEELARKRIDAEVTLQNKLAEHELELEETHQRLEELRQELVASNREEKELRAKDSRNMAQIAALEAEVAKVQKALDGAKLTYSSLQRQYQEQCSFSEKYRDDLRAREETIRSLRESLALYEIESGKWTKEHDRYEERIQQLEQELSTALEAHTQLDEQKQENMLLKETIDRMRFDMDEMRNNMGNLNAGGSSGQSSNANTISKSLGAELMGQWPLSPTEDRSVDDDDSEDGTVIEEEETTVEGDDEDVIQTIITKRKRKVASRAQERESTRRTFEELKEYSDSGVQYDPTLFSVNHGMQTEPEFKPVKVSFEVQTDEIPQPKPVPPPLPRITMEMEIQTDIIEEEPQPAQAAEPSRSPSPVQFESMASSSSTIVPPTPKPLTKQLEALDEPPAYNQVTEADQEEEKAWRTLKKWHHGVELPSQTIEGGVAEETIAEWKALKQELGVECAVIDKIVEASEKIPAGAAARANVKGGKSSRFFNVYNTYIYGNGEKGSAPSPSSSGTASSYLTPMLMMAVSALATYALTSSSSSGGASQAFVIPGGPTYYDRAAWSSFNAMPGAGEGYTADGTAAIWEVMGRVGGTAARLARGWPT